MKQRLLEPQYEQLARERFRQLMESIPFVSQVDIEDTIAPQTVGDFCAVVYFKDGRIPQKFAVEVKSNGEQRFVNAFLTAADQRRSDVCYVFVAPYISEKSAALITENNYSYMDLSGNCRISTADIYIQIDGRPNQYKEQRLNKDYFSKKSSAASVVMRTMLDAPFASWQVKQLAESCGKAIGTVSNVKAFLKAYDWIKEEDTGFTLQNIEEMLYRWAKDYHKKPARTQEYYSLDAVPAVEAKISHYNQTREANIVLGGFSAAARYAPTVRYKKVQAYVAQNELELFVDQLDLQPVTSGGNVVITIPHDETPCMFARTIHGDLVTSPVQTVLDLLGSSGRGEEAAEAIIRKEYGEKHR